MLKMAIVGCAMGLLASCAQTPQAQAPAPQQTGPKPACQAGANAQGIAAGFFSFFTDDLNGCL